MKTVCQGLQKFNQIAVSLLCCLVLGMSNAYAGQCNDGLDNDGDGLVDALVNLPTNTQVFNFTTSSSVEVFVRTTPGGTTIPDGTAVRADAKTGTKVCNMKGYRNGSILAADNFRSCGDNIVAYWTGTAWAKQGACNFNSFISYLRCTDKFAQCSDGKDNDGDGLVDFPADPGCASATDDNETAHDPKCQNPNDPTEFEQCRDGIDNDGDGAKDFGADFSCGSAGDDDETNPKAQCQNGSDDDGDGLIDLIDPGCTNSQDNNEGDGTSQCQDGSDNDGDGLVDMADPGCSNPQDNNEDDGTSQCQDGKDNDGDGLTDSNDPGCSNPQDNDENNPLSPVTLRTECVTNNQDGTYTAYFGYENLSGAAVTIVDNAAQKTINSFSPAPANRSQPSIFAVGLQKGVVAVKFNGTSLVWKIQAAGAASSSATASSTTILCSQIQPKAECIDSNPAGGIKATFGYVNANGFAVEVPIGTLNFFSPGAQDRGQPKSFFAGTNSGAFSVNITDPITWNLNGLAATITSQTPVCPGGCTETSTVSIKGELDDIALQFATLTKKAADFLAKSPKVNGRALKALQTDAKRAKAKADAFVKRANELQLEFPEVIKNCPSFQQVCKTVDRQLTIEALKGLYAQQLTAVKRIVARASFNSSGKTNRMNALVADARALNEKGQASASKLPRFATECK